MPKISDLPVATTPLSGTETTVLVQGGATKKATVNRSYLRYGAWACNLLDYGPPDAYGWTNPFVAMMTDAILLGKPAYIPESATRYQCLSPSVSPNNRSYLWNAPDNATYSIIGDGPGCSVLDLGLADGSQNMGWLNNGGGQRPHLQGVEAYCNYVSSGAGSRTNRHGIRCISNSRLLFRDIWLHNTGSYGFGMETDVDHPL